VERFSLGRKYISRLPSLPNRSFSIAGQRSRDLSSRLVRSLHAIRPRPANRDCEQTLALDRSYAKRVGFLRGLQDYETLVELT
jgi:hypothetical protein